MSRQQCPPSFPLGQVVATPGVLDAVSAVDLASALARHSRGDWGEVEGADWEENNRSIRDGFRLLSAYRTEAGTRFWIITEADRSITTVLLPDEY